MIGLILVVIGAAFLLKNLGILDAAMWNIIWPALLIVVGIRLICWHKCREGKGWCWGKKCPMCNTDKSE